MLRLSSVRFLGLGPCCIGFSKSQNQTYRIKSTNIPIVLMSAKKEEPSIWINEVKKIGIPERVFSLREKSGCATSVLRTEAAQSACASLGSD